MTIKKFCCGLIVLLISQSAVALNFSFSPSYQEDKTTPKLYKLIYDTLKQNIDFYDELVYVPSSDWRRFNTALLSKQIDILIAEPQVTAFAVNYKDGMKMHAIARFPHTTSYHLVVEQGEKFKHYRDLQQRRICMRPQPNYGNVLINLLYDNPVLVPTFVSLNRSDDFLLEKLNQGSCDAAVISDSTYKAKVQTLVSLHQTEEADALGISVSGKIQADTRDKIVELIQKLDLSPYFAGVTSEQRLIAADNDYFEQYEVLAGLITGF